MLYDLHHAITDGATSGNYRFILVQNATNGVFKRKFLIRTSSLEKFVDNENCPKAKIELDWEEVAASCLASSLAPSQWGEDSSTVLG